MPKKCESCRNYRTTTGPATIGRLRRDHFGDNIPTIEVCSYFPVEPYRCGEGLVESMRLDQARDICDREGDGIFVYFEPKEPTSGAAFIGESRAEFERDRMGQTGQDNAAALKAAA